MIHKRSYFFTMSPAGYKNLHKTFAGDNYYVNCGRYCQSSTRSRADSIDHRTSLRMGESLLGIFYCRERYDL